MSQGGTSREYAELTDLSPLSGLSGLQSLNGVIKAPGGARRRDGEADRRRRCAPVSLRRARESGGSRPVPGRTAAASRGASGPGRERASRQHPQLRRIDVRWYSVHISPMLLKHTRNLSAACLSAGPKQEGPGQLPPPQLVLMAQLTGLQLE